MEPEIPIIPTKTRNLYERLGLDINADSDAIKTAYRKSAIYWHPDKNNNPDSHREFIAISEAYEILSEPFSKMRYDSTLERPSGKRTGRPDLSDIFSDLQGNKDSDDLGERLKYYMDKFKDMDIGSFSYATDEIIFDMAGILSIFGMYKKQKKPEEPKRPDMLPDDDKAYK